MDATFVPSEVWIQIFGHLSKLDLKALRLSGSHYLGSLASSLLFKKAYLAARKSVLNTFMALTTHPEFCKYVEEIVYDSSYFSPKVVEKYVNEECGPALATLFKEQEHILDTELQNSMDTALRCLSNIKKVSYADMTRVAFVPGDFDGFSCERHEYGELLVTYRQMSAPLRALKSNCRLEPRYACTGHEDNRKAHTKSGGFVALLQALALNKADELLHLSLGDRTHAAGIGGVSYWFFSRTNAEITHPFLRPVFTSLRTVDLTISSSWPAENMHERCCMSQKPFGNAMVTAADKNFASVDLATLLCLAQNLQEVKLAGECLTYTLRLTDTFSSHTWSKLQVVNLRFFEGSVQEIEDLIKRHAMSLNRLFVDYFVLTSGSWEALGNFLPAVAPNLELIFGLVCVGDRFYPIAYDFPLSSKEFDEYGKIKSASSRRSAEDEDDEDEDSESDSDSDCLSFSSDDSTPSTASNPRRKLDVDLLDTLTPAVREKVEYLQKRLPGCPADHCRNMLDKTNGDSEMARRNLFRLFGYTELECLGPEKGALLELLMEDMPFDVDEVESIQALERSNWD